MTDPVLDQSRAAIRVGSKSFAAAARLFDAESRQDAYLLYAWCRHCDDRIDAQELGHGITPDIERPAEERLEEIRQLTADALSGEEMSDPAFAALQRVVEHNRIPLAYPMHLIEGFEMDVAGRRYETLEDTLSYCYHVAGVVGVMMAYVMGVEDDPTLDRAADLGIAFQLTNISRDVIDDAEMGRVYVPARWLAEAGIPAGEIAAPEHRDALFSVVERLLAEADRYYESSRWGVPSLGFRSAWAISTAHHVYRDIGRRVQVLGSRAWDQRVVVGKPKKLFRVGTGAVSALWSRAAMRHRQPDSRAQLWTRPYPAV